jgi:hypothetical protein
MRCLIIRQIYFYGEMPFLYPIDMVLQSVGLKKEENGDSIISIDKVILRFTTFIP